MADTWIAAYEYRRTGGQSILRLYIEGGWEILRRSTQRTQIVHTADAYLTVLLRIFSRAGLQLTSSAVSSRALTVAPKFTIAPDATGFESVRHALAYLVDCIRMRTIAGATITEPLAAASSDYTFGTNHPLREVALFTKGPGVAEALAFGAGAFGEAIDFTNAAIGAACAKSSAISRARPAPPPQRRRPPASASARSTPPPARSSSRRTAAGSCSTPSTSPTP
jgi:hypothetical protein